VHRLSGTPTRWLAVGAATIAASVGAGALGLPSASLFAALLVGIGYALTGAARAPLQPSRRVMHVAQAIIGVALGTAVDSDTLRAVSADWLPVTLVTLGTLVISLGAGLVMARLTGVDRQTASLGLIAGGATGIVAMADELGADGRLVAFMQYLRVLVVVLIAPPLAHLILEGHGAVTAAAVDDPGLLADLAFTVACTGVGLLLIRVIRLTAGAVLIPLVVAAAVAISGIAGDAHVPDLVQEVAFALIGLQVGLRFTVATIRQAGHLLPATLISIIVLVGACAGLAAILAPLADVTYGDAYLATTPGGLYAVLAAAADIGGNTTFVVAVQALRVFAMVLLAPPLVRLLVGRRRVGAPG
jgi:membrane AbrB-like protein